MTHPIRLTATLFILCVSSPLYVAALAVQGTAMAWCSEESPQRAVEYEGRAQTGSEQLHLRVSEQQPEGASLYRVTSGFFASPEHLGIANAGNGQVVVFGLEDRSVRHIGSSGPGPREFSMLYFAHWDPGDRTVVAYDAGAVAMKSFTLEGDFVGSTRVQRPALFPLFDVVPLPGAGYVGVTTWSFGAGGVRELRGLQQVDVHVLLLDSVGTIVGSAARLPGRSRAVVGEGSGFAVLDLPFTADPWVLVGPRGCFITPTRAGAGIEFRRPGEEGVYKLHVPSSSLELSQEEWERRTAGMGHQGHDLSSIDRPAEKPAWTRAVRDGANRIWLEEFHHRDEPVPAWRVVDLSTNRAMRVEAPEGAFQILAAMPHRIAVLHKDRLDTERVIVYDVVSGR